jgi:hypothetical protein
MSRRKLSRVLTAIGDASNPTRIDLDQAFDEFPEIKLMHDRTVRRRSATLNRSGEPSPSSPRWLSFAQAATSKES